MAKQAEFSLIASFAGEDELVKEMCAQRMKIMRRELAGDNCTPLEKMLIERIALAWLHVHIIEMAVAQRHATMTLAVGEYQQKRLDRAHKRHLSAIKALAQVRKMQLPTPAPQVQINVASNVAQQQVVAQQPARKLQEAPCSSAP